MIESSSTTEGSTQTAAEPGFLETTSRPLMISGSSLIVSYLGAQALVRALDTIRGHAGADPLPSDATIWGVGLAICALGLLAGMWARTRRGLPEIAPLRAYETKDGLLIVFWDLIQAAIFNFFFAFAVGALALIAWNIQPSLSRAFLQPVLWLGLGIIILPLGALGLLGARALAHRVLPRPPPAAPSLDSPSKMLQFPFEAPKGETKGERHRRERRLLDLLAAPHLAEAPKEMSQRAFLWATALAGACAAALMFMPVLLPGWGLYTGLDDIAFSFGGAGLALGCFVGPFFRVLLRQPSRASLEIAWGTGFLAAGLASLINHDTPACWILLAAALGFFLRTRRAFSHQERVARARMEGEMLEASRRPWRTEPDSRRWVFLQAVWILCGLVFCLMAALLATQPLTPLGRVSLAAFEGAGAGFALGWVFFLLKGIHRNRGPGASAGNVFAAL